MPVSHSVARLADAPVILDYPLQAIRREPTRFSGKTPKYGGTLSAKSSKFVRYSLRKGTIIGARTLRQMTWLESVRAASAFALHHRWG